MRGEPITNRTAPTAKTESGKQRLVNYSTGKREDPSPQPGRAVHDDRHSEPHATAPRAPATRNRRRSARRSASACSAWAHSVWPRRRCLGSRRAGFLTPGPSPSPSRFGYRQITAAMERGGEQYGLLCRFSCLIHRIFLPLSIAKRNSNVPQISGRWRGGRGVRNILPPYLTVTLLARLRGLSGS